MRRHTIQIAVAGGSKVHTQNAIDEFKAVMTLLMRTYDLKDCDIAVSVSGGFPGDGQVSGWVKAADPGQAAPRPIRQYWVQQVPQRWRGTRDEIERRNAELFDLNPTHIICMPGGKGLWRFVAAVKNRGWEDRLILISKEERQEAVNEAA